jgi:nodulation protein E
MVLGEGAAILVLEPWERARRRGVKIQGEIIGFGMSSDANDLTEAAALRFVFGGHLKRMPVSASKSMLGHCLNAGGAIEALITALALRDGIVPPTVGFRERDPDCDPDGDLDCVLDAGRRAPLRAALSNSFAFGGLNVALLMRSVE